MKNFCIILLVSFERARYGWRGEQPAQAHAAMRFYLLCAATESQTLMLCRGCGDLLEDANCYQTHVGAKTYRSNCCRPCKRVQMATIRQLRKLHPRPPVNAPCECCARIDKLQLDHEHGGERAFRGWLCKSCNVGIGHLGDSVEGLAQAVAYLARQNTGKIAPRAV